jgi:hypothetical protein
VTVDLTHESPSTRYPHETSPDFGFARSPH